MLSELLPLTINELVLCIVIIFVAYVIKGLSGFGSGFNKWGQSPFNNSVRQLRFMDDTMYLRSGSLNIFNGIISLNFSCDGSHYLPYDEFLNKEHAFWSNGEKC